MTAALHLPILQSPAPVPPSSYPLGSTRQPARWPRYLRVVITAQCPLACSYCHMEGDPAQPGGAGGLPTDEWRALLSIGLQLGVRKLKFLGGEPLVRSDLPQIVRHARAIDPTLDLSIITSGAVPAERLDRLFAAGLSRCNVSIHGFGPEAFASRGQRPGHYALRQRFLDAALAHGRPLKLNYVYTGRGDDEDLRALLEWARGRALVINVLDDLGNPSLGAETLVRVVTRLRGRPVSERIELDPCSLPTRRLLLECGVEVEIKHERLGDHAPWSSCDGCVARSRCREGIHALRLGHTGVLRPCMDRSDLGVDVAAALRAEGPAAAHALWEAFVRGAAR